MSVIALLLASAVALPAPTCKVDAQARDALKATQGATPLGLVVGMGGDWAASYVVVKTTHRLGVPGLEGEMGAQTATYYAVGRERTCYREIPLSSCPALGLEIDAYRARSYPVMLNRDKVRESYAFHQPFTVLRTQDGDGNVANIIVNWHGHPLTTDAAHTFSAIKSCVKDIDEAAGVG